jgi:type VI secretion system secreted protein VgrG
MALSAPLLANQPEFDFEVGPHQVGALSVLDFQAEEGLSRLFEVHLSLAADTDTDVDVPALIGQPALLTLHSGEGVRFFHGVVARMSHSEPDPNAPRAKRFRATVVPKLWRLRHRRQSRIFQDMNVPDIVAKVLKEHGITHRLDLTASDYKTREFCVQYRESDLDFISRLLEEEGITYWFLHEQAEHTLVLLDRNGSFPDLEEDPKVVFLPPSRMVHHHEHVDLISRRLELQPGAVALRDFNHQRPAQDMSVSASADGADAALEVYDYPGLYQEPAEGKALGKVRLEEIRARAEVSEGRSVVRRFTPGRVFELTGYPDDTLNRRYLLVSVRHGGKQIGDAHEQLDADGTVPDAPKKQSYTNAFLCQPAEVPFRPERLTPRPVIHGAQTAIVVGPAGEEIATDDQARIKVQFHWDREGKKDDKSSCWIRVSQAWAGSGWGALFVPRIGHEVLVEFLEGDPDRPIVTGSVYNGANPPPIDLPAQKTKSTLRTSSSPGGNGSNELRFEDAAGSEEIYLHAQKDLTVVVENDKNQTVGGHETLVVRKNRSRLVQGNQALQVDKNDQSTIGGDQSLEVQGNRATLVGKNHTETIGGDQTVAVSGNQSLSVAMTSTENVGAAKTLNVGAVYSVNVGMAMNEVVGAFKSEQVGGSRSESVGGSSTEQVGGSRSLRVKGDLTEEVGKSRSLKVEKDLFVSVTGKVNHAVKGAYAVSAKEINLVAEEGFVIKVGSATLTLKKNGDVIIKGAKIELNAKGDVIIKGSKISEN